MKMEPEVKATWIEALRSGRYAQTTGILKDRKGFCCLGVLCDLHPPETWPVFLGKGYEALGIHGDQVDKLVVMNDGRNGTKQHSFAEIADYIEENL